MERHRRHQARLPAPRRWKLGVFGAVAFLTTVLTAAIAPAPASAAGYVQQVTSGIATSCAVVSDGNAFCWGDNTYGQIGDGTTTTRTQPTLVAGGHKWSSIAIDIDITSAVATTCGVTTTHDAYCWGSNANGAVGDGTSIPRTTPTLVSGGHSWSSITVGYAAVCGVTTSHDAYCWGYGANGQLGNGSTSSSNSPALVSGGFSWSSISLSSISACGITTGGNAYCWGYNAYGELGDGSTTSSNSPVLVSGGLTWSQVSTGTYNACGVTTSHSAYCWGYNAYGEGGNGTTGVDLSPSLVSGGYSWSEISASGFTSCGVTTAGTGYCWGYNGHYEFGDGTNVNKNVPTAVAGGLTFTAISGAGWGVTADSTQCGVTTDGNAFCWGKNDTYQTGNGNTTDQSTPVFVSMPVAASVSMTAVIDPMFIFGVNGQPSGTTCDGLVPSTVATTSTAASLGHFSVGVRGFATQQLQVTTNASNGYTIYMASASPSAPAFKGSNGHAIADSGNNVPLPASGSEFLGYASDSSTNVISSGYISTVPSGLNNQVDVGSAASSPGGVNCIEFAAGASASTPADSYTSTIVYTAVPAF